MTILEVNMVDTRDHNFVMLIPNDVIGDGDAGEPLSEQVITLINATAEIGWWPCDFGEQHDTTTELWFVRGDSVEEARDQAKFFIRAGGYV